MQRERLTANHPVATTSVNIPGVPTPILTFEMEDRIARILHHGEPIFMRLQNNLGNEINPNSQIIICAWEPGMVLPKEIDRFDYAPFSYLSDSQQRDITYQNELRLSLKNLSAIKFEEKQRLIIMVNSPDIVSWANSSFSIELQRILDR